MAVRPFYVTGAFAGRKTEIRGGPRGRLGGGALSLWIRDSGGMARFAGQIVMDSTRTETELSFERRIVWYPGEAFAGMPLILARTIEPARGEARRKKRRRWRRWPTSSTPDPMFAVKEGGED